MFGSRFSIDDCENLVIITRNRKCIFVGYSQGKKGWKLYDLNIGDYFVSRDVKFYETEFSFSLDNISLSSSSRVVAPNFDNIDDEFLYEHVGCDIIRVKKLLMII